ncbi:MAG: hypothetical protein ACTS73_04370 [Arsenophonus sp. NEOnobi-MAG3]
MFDKIASELVEASIKKHHRGGMVVALFNKISSYIHTLNMVKRLKNVKEIEKTA